MPAPDWSGLAAASLAPDRVRHLLEEWRRLPSVGAWLGTVRPAAARALVEVLGASEHLTGLLRRHPGWLALCFSREALAGPRPRDLLRREIGTMLDAALAEADHARALRELRLLRQREHVRIAARDLSRLATLEETTRQLSDVADLCLAGALRVVRARIASMHGEPYEETGDGGWRPTLFCVLGLGKLGGQELNYSSDVDLMLVYGDEGRVFRNPPVPGRPAPSGGMANHQFFRRLAEALVAEVSATTPEGQLFRVDLRLRPEGSAGPLARSLDGHENYYAQWGQTWERLMLIKARPVAGDRALAAEFLEMVQPFRFPRTLAERLVEEIAAAKRRLEDEKSEGDARRDVKRGRGGIREVEFVVQSLQLLNGGRLPFLQDTGTLPSLEKLAEYDLLSREEARVLADAYRFWRDVEHRLQAEHYRQTHAIPDSPAGLGRIARLMGCRTPAEFLAQRDAHADAVRAVYDKFLGNRGGPAAGTGLPGDFDSDAAGWLALLAAHWFEDPARAARRVRELLQGPGWSHQSARTGTLAGGVLVHLLSLCPGSRFPRPPGSRVRGVLSDPDRVLNCVDRYVEAYGSRTPLYEAWAGQPQYFELLAWLFDRSEALGEVAIRSPDLVEELMLSGRLRRTTTAAEAVADLRHGSGDSDQTLWIRRYQQAELLRIGLRLILGYADAPESGAELTALADGCVAYALEVVQRRHHLAEAPFAVMALGSHGGGELCHGSDLDLVLVAPDDAPDLPGLKPLAAEFLQLLTTRTDLGRAYEVDTRLRPDGEEGLLVNTAGAHAEYHRRRAQLWEIQALTRRRFVAGNPVARDAFESAAAAVTDFSRGNPGVAAWTPDWREAVGRMRDRIVRERTAAGLDAVSFKTGAGGLVAAQFRAQEWCLANGWHEPNTRQALARGVGRRKAGAKAGKALLAGYDELRRVEAILRCWSGAADDVLPVQAPALGRVAVRCGFGDAEALLAALAAARKAIAAAVSQ